MREKSYQKMCLLVTEEEEGKAFTGVLTARRLSVSKSAIQSQIC
jgi:hypothetical protein